MDIVEVSSRSGLPASTLRHYEQVGLIRSVGRSGLRRVFHPRVMEQLSLIALGREAGFSLQEISRMFSADGRARIDRTMLVEKANELEATIRRLVVLRRGLRHAAKCPAPSHLECPTFRKLLGEAATRTRKSARTPRLKPQSPKR